MKKSTKIKCYKCGEPTGGFKYDCFVVQSSHRENDRVSLPSMCNKHSKEFMKLYMDWFYDKKIEG